MCRSIGREDKTTIRTKMSTRDMGSTKPLLLCSRLSSCLIYNLFNLGGYNLLGLLTLVTKRHCLNIILLAHACHSDQHFYGPNKKYWGCFWDVGSFYRYRLQIPRNFGLVILANLPTRILVCLLNNAKSPVGMTNVKIKRIFGDIGNFYRYRLQILANLSGKHFGWNGIEAWIFHGHF